MNDKELTAKIRRAQREQQLRSMEAEKTRARSINIGNTGCGEVEINMRGMDGSQLWGCYHPAEVIELIHQLAAAVGCHIALKPRDDFSSWREWKPMTEQDHASLNGWAPFAQLSGNGHMIGAGVLPKGRKFQLGAGCQSPSGAGGPIGEQQ